MIDTLPSDIDAEVQVLGAAIHDPRTLDATGDVLRPADFYRPIHEHLWSLINRRHAAGEPVDPVSMLDAIAAHPTPGLDASYLTGIVTGLVTSGSAPYHAQTVARHARARRLIEAGTRIVQSGYQAATDTDLDSAVEDARATLDGAAGVEAGLTLIGDDIEATIDALDKPVTTIPTPWEPLNHVIGGWGPGRLYVIGARPGVGKSVCGVQAAVEVAAAGGGVYFASLEMSRQDIHLRVLSQRCGIAYQRLEQRSLEKRDWQRVSAVLGDITQLPLAIDDRSDLSITQIRSRARSLARRTDLRMVVVDYLQLMESPRGQQRPRHEVVAGFSRSLKLLAKELGVPVVALSQLNRASEARTDKRPSLADLRESGSVEQDADVVLLLHRDLEGDHPDRLAVGVAKNRHGPLGGVRLEFEGHHMRVSEPRWTPHKVVAS